MKLVTTNLIIYDANSDLHSNIPSVLADNNPHDNSSNSLLTTQPHLMHHNQVIEYNFSQPFQDLIQEPKNEYNNQKKIYTSLLPFYKYSFRYIFIQKTL